MTLQLNIESPLTEDAAALIAGSEAALRAVYTEEECFTFTANELAKPDIAFFVARSQGNAVGCVAAADCGDYIEVKRLFVQPSGRGLGVAKALMAELEGHAVKQGKSLVRLETGDKLEAAVLLYKALGYHVRGSFGSYDDHPASLFMEKSLS
jgi:putative acetyltransferase